MHPTSGRSACTRGRQCACAPSAMQLRASGGSARGLPRGQRGRHDPSVGCHCKSRSGEATSLSTRCWVCLYVLHRSDGTGSSTQAWRPTQFSCGVVCGVAGRSAERRVVLDPAWRSGTGYLSLCILACVRACMHAACAHARCMRSYVRASVRASVHASGFYPKGLGLESQLGRGGDIRPKMPSGCRKARCRWPKTKRAEESPAPPW